MATFNFKDLVKPVTVEEAQAAVYEILASLGIATSAWKTGSVPRSMVRALSIVYSSLSELQADGIKSGFLQLAVGPWLTLKAYYDYAVERLEAAAATGPVTFTNASAYEYNELAGDVTVAASSTRKNYRTLDALNLPAHSTRTVFVVAVESGTGSTAAPGEIDTLVSTLLGVSVVNPDAIVGTDEEADQLLRERCSAKLGALSPNGAPDAYAFAARSARRPDGSSIGITRVQPSNDQLGNVYVTIADGDGEVAPSDVVLVEEAIESVYRVVPLTVYAHVQSAIAVPVSVTADLWVHGSALSDADIQLLVSTALTNFFSLQPVGGNVIAPSTTGYIYLSALRSAIMDAVSTCFHCTISVPAADVALTSMQVAVFSLPVTVNVHQEA
jgi:phage-related baseplate assembly protein